MWFKGELWDGSLCLTLQFSRDIRLKPKSRGSRPGQWGVTMLEGHHMTQRGRGGEFRRCYFLMKSAPRPVFFLKDHQAGSKEICETERTNCQPGSQSRMTAFHSPSQLPPRYFSSVCLSSRLSSSSPSTGHNYSMKKTDFPKQHHPPFIPWSELKAWAWQQGLQISGGKYNWISAVVLSNKKQSQSHYFVYIYMQEMV